VDQESLMLAVADEIKAAGAGANTGERVNIGERVVVPPPTHE
jgi:hypothetical protein